MLCRRSCFDIHSVNYWPYLPEEIKTEILSRLSESDLITSKLVCKEWNFLISTICIPRMSPPLWGFLTFEDLPRPLKPFELDPEPYPDSENFLRLEFVPSEHYYRQREVEDMRGEPTMGDHIMSLLPPMDHDPSHIIDSCNGLVLLAAGSQSYVVGNPVTRQRIAIPVSNQSFHSSLAFDPCISLHFTVVSLTRSAADATPSNPLALDIFSSHSGGWSSHVLPLEPHNLYGFNWIKRSVYFKGALYYMSMSMSLVCIDNVISSGGQCLKAWAVELPDKDKITIEQGKKGLHGCIGYSSGCFYYSNRDTQGAIYVWMLVEKGKHSEWVLKHSIRIDCDVVPHNWVNIVNRWKQLDCFRPRTFYPDDDVMIMGCPRFLVFYHLKTKYAKVAHIPWQHRRKKLVLDNNRIFPYTRSIVSLASVVEQAN